MAREKEGESQIEITLSMVRAGFAGTRAGLAEAGRNSKTGCVGTTENSRPGGYFLDPFRTLQTLYLLSGEIILPPSGLELCDLYHSTMFVGTAIFAEIRYRGKKAEMHER